MIGCGGFSLNRCENIYRNIVGAGGGGGGGGTATPVDWGLKGHIIGNYISLA